MEILSDPGGHGSLFLMLASVNVDPRTLSGAAGSSVDTEADTMLRSHDDHCSTWPH